MTDSVIIIPSPMNKLRTSIMNSYNGTRDTNRAGVYCTLEIDAATFAMFSLREIPLS